MNLNQASPKLQSKRSPPPSCPLDASPLAVCARAAALGVGTRGQAHRTRLALGEDADPGDSGTDTDCSVVYWAGRALFHKALVTTVSITEQFRTRVKGLTN